MKSNLSPEQGVMLNLKLEIDDLNKKVHELQVHYDQKFQSLENYIMIIEKQLVESENLIMTLKDILNMKGDE